MFVVFAPVTGISFFSDFKTFVVSFRPTPPHPAPPPLLFYPLQCFPLKLWFCDHVWTKILTIGPHPSSHTQHRNR